MAQFDIIRNLINHKIVDVMSKPIKAVSLISGGLDSMLATKVILDQGIHVEGINFFTGFCHSGHTSAIRNNKKDKPKRNDALWVAEQLGIKLHIIDVVEEYKDVLLNPQYGYGKNMNPCLDCKIFMVRRAKQWLDDNEFDFIITGEVVGQRPKSQRRETMNVLHKKADVDDRLLRPLCAKLFNPTLPEREGWVDREKLFDFRGRGRRPQIALANDLEIDEFAQPAGGCCVLTDASYSKKLGDLWETRGSREYTLDDIIMLKVGRHIRFKDNIKLIIGREEGENNFLEGYRKQFTHMRITSHTSPMILIDGEPNAEDLYYAARIAGRFSQGREAETVDVEIIQVNGEKQQLRVPPLPVDEVQQAWYV